MYELNLEDFNLNENDVQEDELNIISSNKFKNKVNKEYNNSTLVVEKKVLENSLVELPEEVNIVLKSLMILILLNYLIPHPPCLMSSMSKV